MSWRSTDCSGDLSPNPMVTLNEAAPLAMVEAPRSATPELVASHTERRHHRLGAVIEDRAHETFTWFKDSSPKSSGSRRTR